MSSFLFHRRIVPLAALASIRSRLHPNNGLFQAVATKTLAKQNSSRPFSLFSSTFRVRQFSSNAPGISKLRRVLKFVFIGTGVVFWCVGCVAVFGVVTGRVHFRKSLGVNPAMMAAIFQFDDKEFTQHNTGQGRPQAMKAISEEVGQKQHALMTVWLKLKSEEAFLRKFGKNVNITGYKVQYDIPTNNNNNSDVSNNDDKSEVVTDEVSELLTEGNDNSDVYKNNKDRWNITVYIDGSESSGLVTIEFHKINKDNTFWVPVSLLVETMPNSGVKVCEISAPLPNGLTRFSRLFNDE